MKPPLSCRNSAPPFLLHNKLGRQRFCDADRAFYLCNMKFETQVEELLQVDEKISPNKDLILYNDDHHTFDFVIDALMEICRQDALQAEQCTYLVHYTGKCAVKKGSYKELEPYCTALHDRDLTAEIE